MALRLNDIEAAFRIKAEQGLKALDGIVEKSNRADKSLKNLTDTTRSVGLGLAGLGAAITAAFAFAIKGAAEEQESLAQLQGTVNATGASFEAQRPKIDSFLASLTKTTKFTDDELRPALNRAIVATNDVDKGLRAAELGAKVAAAGFGNLEGNATLVARLFEGQVAAIGRLIPEFRDLEERLEAGATEADLAGEALERLNKIAANAPGPGPIVQLTKAFGELGDAVGATALASLTPFITGLTAAVNAAQSFAQTMAGQVLTNVTLAVGVLATLVGGLLLFTAQLITSSSVVRTWAIEINLAGKAAQFFGVALRFAMGPIGLVLLLGSAIAGLSEHFDNLSKAADKARDKVFTSDRLTQFTEEVKRLRAVLAGLEDGTVSAGKAQKEFNRVGVENEEQARQRVAALDGIIARLTDEKAATEAASKADADRLSADSEGKRSGVTLAKLEEELQKRKELDALQDELAAKELARGTALAAQVTPVAPELPTGDTTIAAFPAAEALDASLANITSGLDDVETAADRVLQGVDVALTTVDESAVRLEQSLAQGVASALDGLATLGANLIVDLASGFDGAAAAASKFFRSLVSDLTRAIARALILAAIISAVGGPTSGIGKFLKKGGLFADSSADQMARFEGQRFVDLFFQGVTREMGNARDRIDASLTDNRNLVENRSGGQTVIVNEASPETTVEWTDRRIEPRVRARKGQRTGQRLDVVGNPI